MFSTLALIIFVIGACQDSGLGSDKFTVTVKVDGTSKVYAYDKNISVGQFLQEIDVVLNPSDQVSPSPQTQLRNGMLITITRVVERIECVDEVLPYQTERQKTQGLLPGEEKVVQLGLNGIGQICYRIEEHDGAIATQQEIKPRPNPVATPRNEIIYVGTEPLETLIPIRGVLAYISSGQAWIIEGNTANARPLTMEGYLDSRAFDLSPDGEHLLYTRRKAEGGFSNELWAILDTSADSPVPVQLIPDDVRLAQWVPGQPTLTVSYSTATPKEDGSGWKAFNDLYLVQLDPGSGEKLGIDEVIPPNALGIYADWGRGFRWSPDGSQLAWANANSIGLVDLKAGEFNPLMSFTEYATSLARAWVWVPTLAWSDDGFLITTVHGPPYGTESPEDSIVFDIAILNMNPESTFTINPFFKTSGIWANPTYSPMVTGPDGNGAYYVAYFQARERLNSPSSEYDLVVADSDGSNPRVVFPEQEKPGFRAPDPADSIAWSPSGTKLAVIYQGNLWIIDLKTEAASQITSDGQASRPRWSRK